MTKEPQFPLEPEPKRSHNGLPHHVWMQAQNAGFGQGKLIIKGWFKQQKEKAKAEAQEKRRQDKLARDKAKAEEKAAKAQAKLDKQAAAKQRHIDERMAIGGRFAKKQEPAPAATGPSLEEQRANLMAMAAKDTAAAAQKLGMPYISADERMKGWTKNDR